MVDFVQIFNLVLQIIHAVFLFDQSQIHFLAGKHLKSLFVHSLIYDSILAFSNSLNEMIIYFLYCIIYSGSVVYFRNLETSSDDLMVIFIIVIHLFGLKFEKILYFIGSQFYLLMFFIYIYKIVIFENYLINIK